MLRYEIRRQADRMNSDRPWVLRRDGLICGFYETAQDAWDDKLTQAGVSATPRTKANTTVFTDVPAPPVACPVQPRLKDLED